ncbi:MAG: oligoendopeptidase F [Acholeplasmataceae bacterium]
MSKWDLSIFYPNDEAWETDLAKLPTFIEKLGSYQGKLGSFEDFKSYYSDQEQTLKLFYRLYAYIHLSSDLNLKDADKQTKNQKVLLQMSRLNQLTSYVSPELISIGQEKIMSFVEQDEYLKQYRFPLEKLFFQQKHVLDGVQEKLLANFGPLRNIPSALYQSLAIIDAKDEIVKLSDGKEMTITGSNFRAILPTLKNPEDRRLVFEAAFKRYADKKTAFANTYNLVLQQLAANYKSRNYPSALDAALFGNNIPTAVFHNLKDVAYENTEPIKRYLKLRKKHLNLEKYRTYDRFLKLATDDTNYSYEEGKKLFLESIKGMDEEFVKAQHEALEDGFVDAYPQDGKRTGAYSSGSHGFHPYILLNHDNTLDGVFTIAHEAGHSAHTIFSQKNQPMAISNYTIFVAEIASTFNEHILLDHLLARAETKEQKIVLLESAIDGIMATFYRQTLFATYEFEANQLVEKGIPVTEKALSEIMINLYKHFYDIDIVEEKYKQYVWAYIPHLFYTPFYVYQYSTSYSASLKIYDDIKQNKPNATDKYLGLLKSGGSDYPVNQAAMAGADLTKKDTFMAVVKRFNALIDQLEDVLEN